MSGRLPEKDSAYHLSIDSKIEATDERIEHVDDRLQEMVKECKQFYQNSNLLKLYLLIGPGCLMAAVTLGFDSAMLNGLQAVPAWLKYFGNPQGATLGILSAVLPLGACCATPFISMVGDRFGRRKGIVTGSAIMFVGAVIQGASVHIAMFLISRFIIGFGLVFANTYAPVLIGELAHPKDRQVITSLYQTSFYLGSIAAAWVTFGTFAMPSELSWRIPSLLQCVPATIQMCSIWFLPESPRWLLARGRREEARAVLIKYHANDDEEDVLVQLEFAEMQAVIEAETANKTPWKALIATPGNRRRLLIIVMLGLFSQWSGNGLISYYLAKVLNTIGITHARDKNIINGSLQIFNWLSAVASAFLTAYLKRRTQFLISVCGMLVVFTMQTLLAGLFNEHHNKHAGTAVVPMLFLFYVFYNLAFNALLYSYPVELLPYPIRAKGFSVLMFFGKAANFVNTFVNPIGLSALGWKYYIVYVAWLVVEILFVFFFIVETKGPSLEAIAAKFDKKNLVIHHDGTAVEKKDATA